MTNKHLTIVLATLLALIVGGGALYALAQVSPGTPVQTVQEQQATPAPEPELPYPEGGGTLILRVNPEFAIHYDADGMVVGAEARGFLVGAPLAYKLGCGFVPARKPGKLPRAVYSQTYDLEYGTDELQMHQDALDADDRVLIVDDLVATGGTAVAAAKLAEQAGADVEGFSFILELEFLKPRDIIAKDYKQEVFSLVKVS